MFITALTMAWSRRLLSLGTLLAITIGTALIGSTGLLFTIPALSDLVPIFATGTSISVFIAIFVVASAVSFGLEQRRREIALLRSAGSTPAQTRNLIMIENLLIGLVGVSLGALLSYPLSSLVINFLKYFDWLPAGSILPNSDYAWIAILVAVVSGLLVSCLASLPASRRASKARPADALLQSILPGKVMTSTRSIIGIITLLGAVAMIILIPIAPISGAIAMSIMSSQVLVIAILLLGPSFIPRLIRIVGAPISWLTRASGMITLAQIKTGVRRVSSTTGPILASVAIFGSLVGTTQTILASEAANNRALVKSDLVIDGSVDTELLGSSISPNSTILPLKTAWGATLEPTDPDDPEEEEAINEEVSILTTDINSLNTMIELTAISGSFGNIQGEYVGISSELAQELGISIGGILEVGFENGEKVSFIVAATGHLPTLIGANIIVGQDNSLPEELEYSVDKTLIRTANQEDFQQITSSVENSKTTEEFISNTEKAGRKENWIIMGLIAGMSTLFMIIAIANTQAMGAFERKNDILLLKQAGSTPMQLVRVIFWEVLLTSLVAAAIGTLVGLISIFSLHKLLDNISADTALIIPWWMFGSLAAVGFVVALLSAIIPLSKLVIDRRI